MKYYLIKFYWLMPKREGVGYNRTEALISVRSVNYETACEKIRENYNKADNFTNLTLEPDYDK